VDETYLKVPGIWKYLYRAVDQFGQVIDVMLSDRRDAKAARRFFHAALHCAARPVEVTTDRAAIYPPVLDELLPGAFHCMEKYANNRVEADHGRLRARLRPMRGLKTDRNTGVIAAGHAFIQNLRRGHSELGVEAAPKHRLADAFHELALAI
jgi:transposase, IS6 family